MYNFLLTSLFIVSGTLTANAQTIPDAIMAGLPISTTTVPLLLQSVAYEEGLAATTTDLYIKVAKCESKFNPMAENLKDPHGGSFGLFQINGSHFNGEMTKAQALTPLFAAHWAAQQFKTGNEHIWSCTKIVKAAEST